MRNFCNIIIYIFILNFSFAQLHNSNYELETDIVESDIVIKGKLVNQESYINDTDNNIFTVYSVQVNEIYKGISNSLVHIVVPGGKVGDEIQLASHSLKLKHNSKGYFILKKEKTLKLKGDNSPNEIFRPNSGELSFFNFDNFNGKISNPILDFKSNKEFSDKIFELTDKKEVIVEGDDFVIISPNLTASINSISPITIGGGNKEILTISGSGFGEFSFVPTNASVLFRNADNGGSSWNESFRSNIVSWTDTEIQIRVPDNSGSGSIRVQKSDGTIIESEQTIEVPYNIWNYADGNNYLTSVEYPIIHLGDNSNNLDHVSNGKWTFKVSEEFNNTPDARNVIQEVINRWSCNAGFDFVLSDEITSNNTRTRGDNINSITFDGKSSYLGICAPSLRICEYSNSEGEVVDQVYAFSEIDIGFLDTMSWSYDEGNVSSQQRDFHSTSAHEFGHALGMGHVTTNGSLMYYASSSGYDGGAYIDDFIDPVLANLDRSINTDFCSYTNRVGISECYTSLSNNIMMKNEFSIYPNPTQEFIFITQPLPKQFDKFTINNISGKIIVEGDLNLDYNISKIDVSNLSSGLFFITLVSSKNLKFPIQAIKFMKQ